ncbi:MAG: DUF1552 domain-containing protein [Pseudomonadota bacterium]
MITSKNRIQRRTMLRGAGGLALGLPFLSAMLAPRRSHADDSMPTRLLVFYTPGGTLLDRWRPQGTAGSFTLQPMMAPLTPFLDRMVFVDGLDLSVTQIGYGHPHNRGMGGVLTGQPLLAGSFNTNGGNAGFAAGASIDQVIAAKISAGLRLPSLQVSAGWSTGITAGGQPHPGNIISYLAPKQAGQPAIPVPPATDPLNTFKRVFTGVGGDADANAKQLAFTTSVLDGVADDFKRLSAQLGAEDRQKLEAHLALVQEAEAGLKQTVVSTCKAPDGVNQTAGYYDDPEAKGATKDSDDGPAGSITTGAKVPEKGQIMSDILVATLACDLTRVASMQWSDSEAKFLLGFLNDSSGASLKDHHHGYQHDRGFQPEALEIIYHFYAEKLAYLLQKLDSVKEGNGTLLDNTLVLAVSEIQSPPDHAQNNMPFILAGKAGGKLAGKRWLKVKSQPHNNLLVSILNLFGVDDTRFGHQDYCTGALSGLV